MVDYHKILAEICPDARLRLALEELGEYWISLGEDLIIKTSEDSDNWVAAELEAVNGRIKTPFELSPEQLDLIRSLALDVLTKREKESLQIKLEMRRAFSNLILADHTIASLLKKACAEAAYRFSTNLVLALTVTDERLASLQIEAAYGVSHKSLNKSVIAANSLLEQVIRLGSIISLPATSNLKLGDLSKLVAEKCRAVQLIGLSAQDKTIGVLILGYPTTDLYHSASTDLLEELATGISLCLFNAKSQLSLAEYNLKLEDLVEERTKELMQQTDKAEDANRSKNKFIANMSHELRTPLTAITGYASVVSSGVLGDVNEKQADSLQNIIKASDHLKELIDEVLNLAKIEAGKETPEPSKIDLKSVVKQVYKLMLQSALSKKIELTLDFSELGESSPTIMFDPRHIRQCLVNLLSNAVKYTREGGTVELKAAPYADKVRVSVTDTGIGMSDEYQQKLFKRFERDDDDYASSQTGTGIGLSLTKHLIELGGGTIGVKSEKDVGSTFWVDLPALEGSKVVVLSDPSHELEERLDGLSIMVIDDNKQTCEVLKMILAERGCEVTTSTTVGEAKGLLERIEFDVLLVDLAIPRESGLELIKHVREKNNVIPIIVVSACVFELDKANAKNYGANAFVAKPFSTGEIVFAIREKVTEAALNLKREALDD